MKSTKAIKHNANVGGTIFSGKRFPEFLVLCFVILLYANSIPNDYNLDDELVTRGHKLTSQGISAIPEIFSSPYYTDGAGYTYEYRPVVLATFAIEHQFFGDNAHVSHFINLLLYALCCLVLYRLLYIILPGSAQLLSLCITLLFAAHPTHTEIVTSIKNRDEILSLLFGLLTIYTTYRAVIGNKKWLFIFVPILFLLALLSKTTVVSLVFIIPLIIILFTEADFQQLLLIVFLLLLPAVFVLELSLWSKLTGTLILVAGLWGFYKIVRSKTQITWQYIKGAGLKIVSRGNDSDIPVEAPALRGFKNLFINIKPDVTVLRFRPFVMAAAAGCLYFFGVNAPFPAAVVVGAFILGLLIIRGTKDAWWWASVVLFCCLAFAPVKYSWDKTLYGELVSAILAYYIFFGSRKLFIPATVIFLIYTALDFHLKDNPVPIVQDRIAGMLALRLIGWPGIFLQAIPLVNLFKHIKPGSFNLSAQLHQIGLGSVFVTLLMLSLIFKTGTRYLVAAFIALAIALMLFFHSRVIEPPLNISLTQNELAKAVNKVNPKLIEIKEDRPLDFIEQPVTNTDPWQLRTGTAFEVIGHYFFQTIWPYPMAFYYGYRFIRPEQITDPAPLISMFIYLALAILAVVLLRKNKLLSLGLFIYLSSLTLFSGYFYPLPGLVAERFMLIPTLGWSIVLGFALFTVFNLSNKLSLKQISSIGVGPKIAFSAILILYSLITFSRNFDWKDDLTLFRHDIALVDESAQAHNLLAIHLIHRSFDVVDASQQKAMREEAVFHLKRAVEVSPVFFNATYDIGRAYTLLNMSDSALAWFIKANSLNPDYTEIEYNMADIYMTSGRYQPAIPVLERAIKRRPQDYRGYAGLSFVYFQMHDYYKSIEVSKQATISTPLNAGPYVNIGTVYLTMNKPDSAELWARKALQIEPSNQGANRIIQQVKKPN